MPSRGTPFEQQVGDSNLQREYKERYNPQGLAGRTRAPGLQKSTWCGGTQAQAYGAGELIGDGAQNDRALMTRQGV